jgi:murein DD-endopeptidase MepM/ murein hydrolase activator NlpD
MIHALESTGMMKQLATVLCILILAACSEATTPAVSAVSAPATTNPTQPAASATASTTSAPSATLEPSLTPPPTPTPSLSQERFAVCSPLQDISLSELESILTNPFQAPSPGRDNGHPGADFAYYHHGNHTTMLGLLVYSSLSGRIAAVIHDRPPYGNAVIIETALSSIPADELASMNLILLPTPSAIDGRLTCPTPDSSILQNYQSDQQSLYLLYAHLNVPVEFAVGDEVTCGQTIGEVGTTGNSVNPHLHVELRLGPASATFASISHYNNQATVEEMSSYCTWRVSGMFQAFNPMFLFTLPNR